MPLPDIIKIRYSATLHNRSFIRARCEGFPIEIHRMLIWCIANPDKAAELLPAWQSLAEQTRPPDHNK